MAKTKSTSKKTAKTKTKKTAVKKIKKPTAKKPTTKKSAKEAKKPAVKKTAKKIIKKSTISIAKIKGKKPPKKTVEKIPPVRQVPQAQKDNKITLMVVDPWKLFAYWNIDESSLAKTRGVLVLRVYDITRISFDGRNANIVFDIAVYEHAGNSYIGVGPDREFVVDIGIVLHGKGFITLARSNRVTTPMLKAGRAVEEAVFSAGLF